MFGHIFFNKPNEHMKQLISLSVLALLLATGKRVIVEASPSDKIWGIGRSVEEAQRGMPWRGSNLLGEALMHVRGLIQTD